LISAGARPRAALPGVIFLSKPFNIQHLIEVVSEKLGRVGSEHYES
jgi:hypothetical protein